MRRTCFWHAMPILGALVLISTAWVSAQSTPDAAGTERAIKGDLASIQGKWVRSERAGLLSTRRTTKEIDGTKEKVTYYDSSGNVVAAHTVDIELHRFGPVRVFEFKNQHFVAGPNQGQTNPGGAAYVYTVSEDRFVEVWGLLAGQEGGEIQVMEWKRAEDKE